jgi:hypothetical protein
MFTHKHMTMGQLWVCRLPPHLGKRYIDKLVSSLDQEKHQFDMANRSYKSHLMKLFQQPANLLGIYNLSNSSQIKLDLYMACMNPSSKKGPSSNIFYKSILFLHFHTEYMLG